MNVFIMTDLEGISGVDTIGHVMNVGSAEHRFACERLMADANAAVEGAVRAGADKIFVCDGHGPANSFIDELLHPRATKIAAGTFSQIMREESIEAYLQVGAHAMPGTLNGFLDHVQSSATWYNYKINGKCYGEIVQGSIFAGALGIPCVMVAGDEAACAEAKACLGENIATAAVKRGIGRNNAECYDLALAEERIRDAAEDGIRRRGEITPFTLPMPITLTLELMRSDFCDERYAACKKNLTRLDARTLEFTTDKITDYNDIMFW